MAYVDGELDAEAAAAVERALRADPTVADAITRARALRERLRHAYDPVLDEALPQRLQALAGPPQARPRSGPAPAAARRGRRPRRAAGGWRGRHWAAMAACLLLGLLLAPRLQQALAPAQLQATADGLVAGGRLADALETGLAADAADGDRIRLGLSFRGGDGRYCRSFVLADRSLAGLACRATDGNWRVAAVAEAAPAGGELRLAASALPPALLAEIDARLQEVDPLDAAGERAARDAGWE
ncbi:MAG: hypothetical protein ACLGHW_08385 [Gammaproteobacteria bacterium]